MIKKIFTNIINVDSKHHITTMLVVILSFSVIITLFTMRTDIENSKQNIETYKNLFSSDLEEYKNLLTELDQEQNKIIAQLKNHLTDSEEKESITLDNINKIESDIQDIRIELDEISKQSFDYMLIDIWDEIDLIKKKVK